MTACRDRLPALLRADLSELEHPDDSELGLHLGACVSCRAAADLILEDARRMRAEMSGAAPPIDAAAVVARARSADASSEPVGADDSGAHVPRTSQRAWIPLAAAAVVATIIVVADPWGTTPGDPEGHASQAIQALEISADGNVVVIPTSNPDITLLWFYP